MRIRFRPVTLFILVALAVALGLPASASAAAPQVTTSVISPDGTSTAEVDGQVDPEGIGGDLPGRVRPAELRLVHQWGRLRLACKHD
jgi:hypothetical protein